MKKNYGWKSYKLTEPLDTSKLKPRDKFYWQYDATGKNLKAILITSLHGKVKRYIPVKPEKRK